jgi:nucleoside-diphosphate-sugar epimerase
MEGEPFTAYGASKAAGEIAVAAALKGSPTELVVVRPAGIGGAESPGSWGSIRRLVEAGKRVPVPQANVRYDVVEIEEVVTFLTDALCGRVPAGVHALLGKHPVTLAEYADLMGRVSGKPARVVQVPRWLLKTATIPLSAVQRLVAPLARVDQLVSTLTDQRPLAIPSPTESRQA